MKEAVVYIFIKGTRVLVEDRLIGSGEAFGIMVPGGGVEEHDMVAGKDYREVAMVREIQEELEGNVTVSMYQYVDTIIRKQTGTPFHIFLITQWEGEIPEYIIEDGEKDGKLDWMEIDEVLKFTKNQVTVDSLQKIKNFSKFFFDY